MNMKSWESLLFGSAGTEYIDYEDRKNKIYHAVCR